MPAITPLDPEYDIVMYLSGGTFIGCLVVLFLIGVLTTQVNSYYVYYKDDKLSLRVAIGILYLLAVIKAMQSFEILWVHYILWGQDPVGAISRPTPWYEMASVPLGAIIGFYVQSYYLYRLWALSKKWWVPVPVALVMLLGVLMGIISAILNKTSRISNTVFAIHTDCTFIADVLITLLSVFFLVRAKRHVLSRSTDLVNSLIKLSFQAALPASACAFTLLVAARVSKALTTDAATAIILVLLHVLPLVYCNSMMYLLNTRRSLQLGSSTHMSSSTGHQSRPTRVGRRTGTSGNPDVELGVLSGIQVHTQVDTVADVLSRDQFDNKAPLEPSDDETSKGHSKNIMSFASP
ncbi:hypothetical protein DL96DRAFT_1812121 [Flagelloscypha sp. PMI_526]|nr:hypothetical protein DL96DRAFT_1812121 [Flagelloscypha sp. PMI_526]